MESYHPVFYLPRHPQTKLFEARTVIHFRWPTQVWNGWGRVCVSVVLLFYSSICLWAAELSLQGSGFLSLSSAGHSPMYACFALSFLDTPSVEPEVSGFTWPLWDGWSLSGTDLRICGLVDGWVTAGSFRRMWTYFTFWGEVIAKEHTAQVTTGEFWEGFPPMDKAWPMFSVAWIDQF